MAILLDPPYKTKGRFKKAYQSEDQSDEVAEDAYAWAVANGSKYRIAYCCADGDFDCPDGWDAYTGRLHSQRTVKENQRRDLIFFSPLAKQSDQLALFE